VPAGVRRLRLGVGVMACVFLPGASWIEGSKLFAWSMYSRAGEFRIDLVAFDADGRAHSRNPTVLAEHAAPEAASLLAGSEHWREGPSVAVLRVHLPALVAYACRELGASSVGITLYERTGPDRQRATTERRGCRP
jgi:hypothetical protein